MTAHLARCSGVLIAHAGDLTVPNVINSLVAIGALLTAIFALFAIRASNKTAQAAVDQAKSSEKVAAASEMQADATRDSVNAALKELALVQDQVDVGKAQVEVSQAAVRATVRPIIVDIPPGQFLTTVLKITVDRAAVTADLADGVLLLDVPFRNIGPGPAFIETGGVRFGIDALPLPGEPFRGAVASGEFGSLRLVLKTGETGFDTLVEQITEHREFRAAVTYTDVGITEYETAFTLHWDTGLSSYTVLSMVLNDPDTLIPPGNHVTDAAPAGPL
jgi:hypothetical protein